MTITLPPIALPPVTVQAAPPALITRRNAEHLGMSGDELVRILRDMRADPRFRDAVIVRGKSFRAAAPDSILEFLRAMTAAPTNDTLLDASDASDADPEVDDGVDMSLLRAAGYDLESAASKDQTARGTRAVTRARPAGNR